MLKLPFFRSCIYIGKIKLYYNKQAYFHVIFTMMLLNCYLTLCSGFILINRLDKWLFFFHWMSECLLNRKSAPTKFYLKCSH